MQVLSDRDELMYMQLVRLAGGNSDIVMRVLSKPRRQVSLTTVIREIEALRDQHSEQCTIQPVNDK